MTNELTTTDFNTLDRMDEDQIIAELQGAVAQDMIYNFRSGGKQVTGLSWSGVKHLAARLGNIQVDLLQVLDNENSWCVLCKAMVGESSRIGAAEQSKMLKTRNGEQPDPFALPKATSKAQRNAIRALLPEKLIIETIKAHAAISAQANPAQAQPSQPQPVNPKSAKSNGSRSPKVEFANQMVAELKIPVSEVGEVLALIGGFDELQLDTLKSWVRFVVNLSKDLEVEPEEVAEALNRRYNKFDPKKLNEQREFIISCLSHNEIPF